MSRSVKAEMSWNGRRLLCNGVMIAQIWHPDWRPDQPWVGLFSFAPNTRDYRSERTVRRAINRRFKLPPDFGETK